MAITDVGARPVEEHEAGGKGLKVGALGLVSSLVIGVASTAPAYSLAASLGLVTAVVGLFAPSIMLIAFIPMLFIAAAYYYMNRADPDCGTTFTWVTRAIGPKTGWLAGWGILVTDLVVMPSLSQIAGSYRLRSSGPTGWRRARSG
jgi:amino acid transporter